MKGVSDSGSLTLQDMTSEQEGVYTCELSDEDGTIITNISVRISQEDQGTVTGVIIGVVVAIVIIGAIILVVKCWKRAGGATAERDVELQSPERPH